MAKREIAIQKLDGKFNIKLIQFEEDRDLIIFRIGDMKEGIIPDMEMLKNFSDMVAACMKEETPFLFVPSFVNVQKIVLKGKKKKVKLHGRN